MARSYKKIEYDNKTFDSESEMEFYKLLIKAKDEGRIKDFTCNPKYVLLEGDWVNWRGDKQQPICHYPDYKVTLLNDTEIILDSKGGSVKEHETDAILKKKIWEYLNREIPYYYVSVTGKYLGNLWVESSPYHDFYTKLKNKYQPAWEISTSDMIKFYAIVQKWTDQGISADLFVKILGDQKVSSAQILQDYLDMVKYGLKSRYYVNSLTSAGVDLAKEESAIAATTIEPVNTDDGYCESCTI